MCKILIKQCPDGHRWYSNLIGETVPYLGDMGDEYRSREPVGYINFVQYRDGEVVMCKGGESMECKYSGN